MTSILITGGTGSLGNALTAALIRQADVERITIYSRDELKQSEMAERFPDARLRFFLGDVRDPERLGLALRGVDRVVHAAALKRVDAVAYNPSELMRTNILGTHNVCLAAIREGVGRVLLVSSDKGVRPTNIYGASKQFAEQLTISSNSYSHVTERGLATRLSCVRYGNVLGSRGSVVHAWRAAVAAGKMLRLTDAAMTRFCMTLQEACRLVGWTLAHMQGGEIVVPALPTMRLVDLADAVAPLGYPRMIAGWRPGGEKMHEALATVDERRRSVLVEPEVGEDPYMVIAPHLHSWTAAWPWRARDVITDWFPDDGSDYMSDRNPHVLSVEQLRALVAEVP